MNLKTSLKGSLGRTLASSWPLAGLRFFFVRGYMRSGTNWLSNLLDKHPQISCAGEFHFGRMCGEFRNLIDLDPPESWGILRKTGDRRLIERQFERMSKRFIVLGNVHRHGFRPWIRWYGDRTASTLEPIVFRNAPHILMVRDGRDVIVSETFHFLRMTDVGDYPFEEFPRMSVKRRAYLESARRFEDCPQELFDDEGWVRSRARHWSQAVLQDDATVEKFRTGQLEGRVLVVHYEDLHRHVERHRRALFEFLGSSHRRAKGLDALTVPGFEEGVRRRAHYRSGKVGEWTRYFTPQSTSWYLDEASAALETHGYLSSNVDGNRGSDAVRGVGGSETSDPEPEESGGSKGVTA